MDSYFMLACRNIEKELLKTVGEAGASFPIMFVPPHLHMFPDKLRTYLQEAIDNLVNVDYILLPMGLCGNGPLGLRSENATIVLPKCNDCIDLMLSKENSKEPRPAYSFFLTEGWLGNANSIDSEYDGIIKKYGEKRGKELISMIYNNYKHFTFIDTETYDLQAMAERIKPIAEAADMEINHIKGEYSILKKMVRLQFDSSFAIVPPGETVSQSYF